MVSIITSNASRHTGPGRKYQLQPSENTTAHNASIIDLRYDGMHLGTWLEMLRYIDGMDMNLQGVIHCPNWLGLHLLLLYDNMRLLQH